jgi:WD40 repeat protein
MPGRHSARSRTAAARRRGLSGGGGGGGASGGGSPATVGAGHALAALHSGRSLTSSYQAPPALYYNQARHQLLFCSTSIQRYDLHELRLSRSSHARPIVGVLYNPNFQSALSADERMVSVWDVATGQSVFRFDTGAESGTGGHEDGAGAGSDVVPPPAITAISFDHGKMRLVTGATDGRLRLWNFSKGSKLYACPHPYLSPLLMLACACADCRAEFVQQFEKPSHRSASTHASNPSSNVVERGAALAWKAQTPKLNAARTRRHHHRR